MTALGYDSFGQVTSETNPDFDFRFGYTGRERDDATGLMYYRARYYDPAVGRFISEDPMGFDIVVAAGAIVGVGIIINAQLKDVGSSRGN